MQNELNSKKKREIENILLKFVISDEQLKIAQLQREEFSKKALDYMQDFDLKYYILNIDQERHNLTPVAKKVSRTKRTQINFNASLLKDKLDSELFNEVSEKTISIPDMDKMKKLLKKYNVPASEFKKLVDVDYKINSARLQDSYKDGEIDIEKLKGTYIIKETEFLTIK